MKTNFRVAKRKIEGEIRYSLHRGYYDDKGQEVAVSEEPVIIAASNPVRLRALIANAFKLPVIDLTD